MPEIAKLLKLEVRNLGCIGNEGIQISLDNIVCLVGENNSGKSTILKTYNIAVGNGAYLFEKDHCKLSEDDELTEVILDVHIPTGVANIGENWKIEENGFKIIRSKWQWDTHSNRTRSTFNPEIGDFDPNLNAAGLDSVFNSRIPKPLKIGALESPESNFNSLKKILLDNIAKKLENFVKTPGTPINDSLSGLKTQINDFLKPMEDALTNAKEKIQENHAKIFPQIQITFDLGFEELKLRCLESLIKGSDLLFTEFEKDIKWDSQGTGSKRALFWTFISIHSELQDALDAEKTLKKQVQSKRKAITKLIAGIKSAVRENTKNDKKAKLETEWSEYKTQLQSLHLGEFQNTDSILPSYILLIDEPEIALHPSAIQAASDLLYEFAEDSNWQVILSTHSPEFIDPFKDHTTIVRVERSKIKSTPSTYRTSDISFSTIEKDNLKLLNLFEHSISQMFFGQHPIIVEGDTEYGAFIKIMNSEPLSYPKNQRPVIIRARGKYQIISIAKMLSHFGSNFSILHDVDYPKTKTGKKMQHGLQTLKYMMK